MAVVEAFLEILSRPTVGGIVVGLLMFMGPVWIAFLIGIMVGWAWKPRWSGFGSCKFEPSAPTSPLASNSLPVKEFDLNRSFSSSKVQKPDFGSHITDKSVDFKEQLTLPVIDKPDCGSLQPKRQESTVVTEEDLEHLCHLVERKDGGPPWKQMMDRSTPHMTYQAWQREPQTGPPQYCSRTVYEDATPELLRDFFWDDEFRLKWDDMLMHAGTMEECPTTGTMVVHWIRKFPFFCSDREYIIGRRIWESGRSYYCVTKGVPHPSIPRKDKPRRVDLFYSSWFIQAVGSKRGNGTLTACEVILFHHEDMGIPWEIAKFGIRQGMWGAVRKIERGLCAYRKARASGEPPSRPAFMAQINTKIDPDYMKTMESEEDYRKTEVAAASEKAGGMNIPKLLVLFGGAVIVACTLDRGLFSKAIVFGVGRTLANLGRRGMPNDRIAG